MERLIESCNMSKNYPTNLLNHNHYKHTLEAYIQRLNEDEDRLFHDSSKTQLYLWEMKDLTRGMCING